MSKKNNRHYRPSPTSAILGAPSTTPTAPHAPTPTASPMPSSSLTSAILGAPSPTPTASPAPTPTSSPQSPQIETDIAAQMSRLRSEGYTVLPASFTPGNYDGSMRILNFASSAASSSCSDGCSSSLSRGPINNPFRTAGHFTGTSVARPTPDDIGTPGKGYIPYGSTNTLPNAISLANSLLIYTAKALEFNIDTLCGLGVEPVYRYHTTVGCNENDECIAYEHAGSYIKRRIQQLRKELFTLLKDHVATPSSPSSAVHGAPSPTSPSSPSSPSSAVHGASSLSLSAAQFPCASPSSPSSAILGVPSTTPTASPTIITPSPKFDLPDDAEDPESPVQNSPTLDIIDLHAPDGLGYKRHADLVLDDIIRTYNDEIARLESDYQKWARTNARLREFQRSTNQTRLMHGIATDMASFYLCYPELLLDQQASKQPDSGRWKPKIVGISYRSLLSTRLEEKDDYGISRFVYVSNKWLEQTTTPGSEKSGEPEFASSHDDSIAAIPALNPMRAVDDLDERLRHFRSEAQSVQDRLDNARKDGNEEQAAQLESKLTDYAPSARPCRFVIPVDYSIAGRHYYPIPPYWAIFQDIYLYAASIIRDRAIRKENESMFTYILYVHQGYLDALTNQIEAQKTETEKEAIKHRAVQDIKDFLSNKQNNGSTLAACTFVGVDGKDHDAFRVERIDFANAKSNADGNRLELSDISGLIMFAYSCHPDLIGSTPGGASSSGGTYQREMLLIKQSMVAHMQNLLLYPWFVTRDFNHWDPHLSFRIKQRVLTTLDASKTGLKEE